MFSKESLNKMSTTIVYTFVMFCQIPGTVWTTAHHRRCCSSLALFSGGPSPWAMLGSCPTQQASGYLPGRVGPSSCWGLCCALCWLQVVVPNSGDMGADGRLKAAAVNRPQQSRTRKNFNVASCSMYLQGTQITGC